MSLEERLETTLAGGAAFAIMTSAVPKMHERKAKVTLERIDAQGNIASNKSSLQYFPESISDTYTTNYAQKAVPGASLPLYQWINGGERIISFTAVFSSDIDLSLEGAVGGSLIDEVKAAGVEDRNVDVKAAIAWLRSFMLPVYSFSPDREYQVPPHQVLMSIPKSGIGLGAGAEGSLRYVDSVLCVMTQCDVEYKAFFPSGVPRFATVQLSFSQTPQQGGVVNFPGNTIEYEEIIAEGHGFPGGYKLTR